MGFKDLEKFNDAMLAKQVWRLLRDQNSLFFHVFKAKYFPKSSVLEATTSSGSYAWQSIMKARKVISKGMRWRIGDGKSINLYCDNWLPGGGSSKIISPQVPKLEGAKVSTLISQDTAQETTLHAIWSCEELQEIWLTYFSWVRAEYPNISEVQELINLVGMQKQRLELFAVVAWFVWNRRNKLRLKEPSLDKSKIFSAAAQYLSAFQLKFPMKVAKSPAIETKWSPPLGEEYKTNYDGAVFEDSGEAGIGVVVRNATSEVLATLSEKIPYPGSVDLVEILAARRVVRFIVELGMSQSIFEGDSEIVYKALKSVDVGHSSIGQYVKDIMSISSSLQTFSFSHTRRQGNCVAHALAKRARFSFPLLVWMEHVPSNVIPIVVSDL
ncbi:uncharacterized protein LOC126703913 [Quercus robur]|uniref:uncharacterized protein LOC126703913 n=1 Tax=Quercus robur TaxID=38942 RepID=UPI0021635ED6|nr:uncharacterized protein LOC126703913 [Quercus robur]